ncbi:MAG: IS110 family transposase [Gammaproteobacteria bacterium]|nr:IS110 family transposase [Gammaproteobacteria bacterium]
MNDFETLSLYSSPPTGTGTAIPAHTGSDTIYIALELSLKTWVVGILGPDGRLSCHKVPAMDTGKLVELIDRGDPARTLVTYEAGFEGFWLARWLQDRDIRVVVNDPASLELPRKSRVRKTDRIDVKRMVRALKAWNQGDRDALSAVRVPTVEEEDRRRLLRERDEVVRQRTACSNRIVGLLRVQGIRDLHPREKGFLTKLGCVRTGDDREIPPCLKEEVERHYAQYCGLRDWIDVLEQKKKALQKEGVAIAGESNTGPEQEPTPNPPPEGMQSRESIPDAEDSDRKLARQIHALTRLRGIGLNDAVLLCHEVFWREFENRRQIASWAGLAPVPWASGEVDHCQGIGKTGPGRVRKHLIQMAWRWVRYQPGSALARWFERQTKQAGSRKRAIVAVARKLLIALWRLATLGVVPDGAELSGSAT